ncbi:MAG: hypothetical protein DHS20C17_34580 [Cyclobacteriaceae bacterium]|nr:MAG: hypothetical protein DHS20C17_34580 [Cyclobacteriaceae bacterium]
MNFASLLQRLIAFSTSGRASILVLIVCLLFTVWVRKNGFEGYQFGQEIGNVSAALASGQGFSNVFGPNTGPTAWTPVAYTVIYALVFLIFGVKTVYSYWALFFLRCALIAVTFHLAVRISYSSRLDRYKFLLLPLFMLYTYFVMLKRGMDDVIFNVSLSMLVIYVIAGLLDQGYKKVKIWLYILALILPLANISLFIGYILLIIGTQFSTKREYIPKIHAFALLILLITSMAGWGLRNQAVFGKFIPFKSNLWFEMYLSNVADEDGILKFTNFRQYHPLTNEQVRKVYIAQGEAAFLEYYRNESSEYLKTNLTDFASKLIGRARSVFVWTEFNINNVEKVDHELPGEDIAQLETAGLIDSGYWLCLDVTQQQFLNIVANLHLSSEDQITSDWQAKKQINKQSKLKLNNLALGLLMSFLPSLALICCFLLPIVRESKVFWIALGFFILTIGPYLLISIHTRYQLFQMSYYFLFVFMALAGIMDRFFPGLVDKRLIVIA